MPRNDYITNLLDLKDKNIIINDTITTKTIKGLTYKVIEGTLSYTNDCCPVCSAFRKMNFFKVLKPGSNK